MRSAKTPERVQFVGYSPQFLALHRFLLSLAFSRGIAGGLAAINFEIMNTQSIGAAQSGSRPSHDVHRRRRLVFIGPIIGAILISFLQIMLPDL